MNVEAYNVQFEKNNYHAPIADLERQEETLQARENEIKDNLLRYIGEYRLGVKFDEYFYHEETDVETGERYLTSKEPGPIRDIYRRAIADKEKKGLSVRREVAECLGFEKLEKELLSSPVGTMAIWISPPEDESGYSFTFIAQSEEKEGGKSIRMIPYRNELSIQEHNTYIERITGREVNFQKDTEFLSSPFIVSQTSQLWSSEDILKAIGEKEEFDNSWYEDFAKKSWPLIQGIFSLVRENASDEELVGARNALENFAIAYRLDKDISIIDIELPESIPFGYFVDQWGSTKPPIVMGSCGSTDSSEVNLNPTLPMEFQQSFGKKGADEDDYGKREFKCPSCKTKIKRAYNKLVKKCPNEKCEKPESVAC